MSDQDLIIQEKIKKREKTDTILSYILIIILLSLIAFIVYMKFIKKEKENNKEPIEYVANYIKLDDIASDISSSLNNKYNGISAISRENSLSVNYGDLSYNIPLINNELEVTIDSDNEELSKNIYQSIISSVCIFYNNNVDGCKNSANNINSSISSVRFLDNKIYISLTNSIDIIDSIKYTEETIVGIDNTSYELLINNTSINNINVKENDVNIVISGDISKPCTVSVKLYDDNDTLIEEKANNFTNNFSISFDYSDKLNIDSIKKYSINIE